MLTTREREVLAGRFGERAPAIASWIERRQAGIAEIQARMREAAVEAPARPRNYTEWKALKAEGQRRQEKMAKIGDSIRRSLPKPDGPTTAERYAAAVLRDPNASERLRQIARGEIQGARSPEEWKARFGKRAGAT